MKISQNFDVREWVDKDTYSKFGERSRWFVNEKCVKLAEFYKVFFLEHFQKQNPNVTNVLVCINNWHTGGVQQYRGYRPPDCTTGAKQSQHRAFNAFDCDVIIVTKDGARTEVSQAELHNIIKENWPEFKANGLTTIEDESIATTWLHSDCRWTGSEELLIVKP